MAKEIKLPKLSEDADEGTVAEVMIQEGDTIEEDESVIAVESDKATVEVPSEAAGTVGEVKVSEGDTIKTGDVIAVLEEEGQSGNGEDNEEKEEKAGQDEESEEEQEEEKDQQGEQEDEEQESEKSDEDLGEENSDEEEEKSGDEEAAKEKNEKQEEDKSGEKEKQDEKSKEVEEEAEETEEETESSGSEGVHAAPGAKRLARESGLNLEDIAGTGPDGLVTGDDVKEAAGKAVGKKAAAPSLELPDFSQWGSVERQSLSEIRKVTARQTQGSWQTVPHVTQFDEADVSGIEEYIGQHQGEVEEQGGNVTIPAVLAKVIANALHRFPKFNASIDMEAEEVILTKYVHIGIAVNTDEGLLVPIVRDVDQKSIIELATEITGLAEKARNKDLSGEDMEGGNFIISNLGGIGGTQFTPVIFYPQVAILGASEMTTRPVYQKETESFQPVVTLPLSLSYDHRLIDGAEGVRFLRYVRNALEDPYKALLGA